MASDALQLGLNATLLRFLQRYSLGVLFHEMGGEAWKDAGK